LLDDLRQQQIEGWVTTEYNTIDPARYLSIKRKKGYLTDTQRFSFGGTGKCIHIMKE
jgi:hypothetical protein